MYNVVPVVPEAHAPAGLPLTCKNPCNIA